MLLVEVAAAVVAASASVTLEHTTLLPVYCRGWISILPVHDALRGGAVNPDMFKFFYTAIKRLDKYVTLYNT